MSSNDVGRNLGSQIPADEKLLTVDEVAGILRVPKSWVYSHLGDLPAIRLCRYVRFRRGDIEDFLGEKSDLRVIGQDGTHKFTVEAPRKENRGAGTTPETPSQGLGDEVEDLLLGLQFRQALCPYKELGEEQVSELGRGPAGSRPLPSRHQRTEQPTSTISPWGRNTRSIGGNVSRKDLAVAEELDTNQLRLLSRHAHPPEVGSVKFAKMTTIELQDFFNSFSPRLALKTIRNMHGCLRTVLSQGKTWGIHTRESCQGDSPSEQEGKETCCVAFQAGYSPCDRCADRADQVHCYVDGGWLFADRRDQGSALGTNSAGSNRNR
jgi:Helix-turn-helix domain